MPPTTTTDLELTLVVVEPEVETTEDREAAFWNWNTEPGALERAWTPKNERN
jgi:hypothetical protein